MATFVLQSTLHARAHAPAAVTAAAAAGGAR